jgi:hypothetical protein
MKVPVGIVSRMVRARSKGTARSLENADMPICDAEIPCLESCGGQR